MCSTPLISCSSGVATVADTTSAFAPGYDVLTTIVGGTTSGYCATGSVPYEIAPTITITIDRTVAKIGRSMKKRERFIVRPAVRRLAADRECARSREARPT